MEVLIAAALLVASAFFSSTEAALFSLSRYQIRRLKEFTPKIHAHVRALLQDTAGSLLTLLVCNELVNVSLSTFLAHRWNRVWEAHRIAGVPDWLGLLGLSALLTTPLVLLFGEVVPKSLAVRTNQWHIAFSARILFFFYRLLGPIRMPMQRWLSRMAARDPTKHAAPSESISSEEELLELVRESQREGELHQNEARLIKNTLELDDTEVQRIATPMSRVLSFPDTLTVVQALERLKSRPFSRIPIVTVKHKEIVVQGILYRKDLIESKFRGDRGAGSVTEMMRPVYFVPETMRAHQVFRQMRERRVHMAVLVNSQRQPTGIVTLNDVLEDLFEGLEARK